MLIKNYVSTGSSLIEFWTNSSFFGSDLSLTDLLNDRKKQETQINSINMYLKEIVNDFSPYDVSVNRINKLINPSSKAN